MRLSTATILMLSFLGGAALADAAGPGGGAPAPADVPALVGRLAAPDAEARRDACRALAAAWPDSARSVPALIDVASDDESEPVRRAAADALTALGHAGAADFGASVTRLGAVAVGAGVRDAVMLGPALTPKDVVASVRSGKSRAGALVTLPFHAYDLPPGVPRGTFAEAVADLDAADDAERGTARACLAAAAMRAAVQAGADPPATGPWPETATRCLDSGLEPLVWLGVRMFGTVARAGAESRDRIAGAVSGRGVVRTAHPTDAIALAGPVPADRAAGLVRALDWAAVRHHRRLGLTAALAAEWGAAEGTDADARKWVAARLGDEKGDAAALLRRVESARADESVGVAGRALQRIAARASGPDVRPFLLDKHPDVRCAVAAAILDATPGDVEASGMLRRLAAEGGDAARPAFHVLSDLPPGAARIDVSGLVSALGQEGPPGTVPVRAPNTDAVRLAGRLGGAAKAAVPALTRWAAAVAGSLGAEGRTADPHGLDPLELGPGYVTLAESVRALGRIGPPATEALPLLRELAVARDPELVQVARTALRRISPADPLLGAPVAWKGPPAWTSEQRREERRRREAASPAAASARSPAAPQPPGPVTVRLVAADGGAVPSGAGLFWRYRAPGVVVEFPAPMAWRTPGPQVVASPDLRGIHHGRGGMPSDGVGEWSVGARTEEGATGEVAVRPGMAEPAELRLGLPARLLVQIQGLDPRVPHEAVGVVVTDAFGSGRGLTVGPDRTGRTEPMEPGAVEVELAVAPSGRTSGRLVVVRATTTLAPGENPLTVAAPPLVPLRFELGRLYGSEWMEISVKGERRPHASVRVQFDAEGSVTLPFVAPGDYAFVIAGWSRTVRVPEDGAVRP